MKRLLTILLLVALLASGCTRSSEAPPKLPGIPEVTTPTLVPTVVLQEGNNLPRTQLQPKESPELGDNYIGTDLGSYGPGYNNPRVVYPVGFKWIRISFNTDPLNWQYVETDAGDGTLVIRNLLIKDYPTILHTSDRQ